MTALAGAVAVVAGGASGIGRSCARSFGRHGARLIVADVDVEGADAVAAEIRAASGEAIAVPGDVTAEGTFERLRDAAVDEFGGVDVIMNNVGAITRGFPEHIPIEEWRRILEINLLSVVRSNAVFLPYLLERGRGHIVNTASFAGLYTYSYDRLPYGAAKAAVVQLSEGLRLYLEPRGIGVTMLCPGPTRTNISSTMRTWGPETVTRGPGAEFAFIEPDVVGEKVADAVEAGTFVIYTDEKVVDKLVLRASDWNAFIDSQ